MSAWPEDPEHFLRWARAHVPDAGSGAFLPRALYGTYLAGLLDDASPEGGGGALVRRSGEAVDLTASASGASHAPAAPEAPLTVLLRDGGRLPAHAIVLAPGNAPPEDPLAGRGEPLPDALYARDPWRAEALAGLAPEAEVVVLGTGLTTVDLVLSLRAAGHRGRVVAVSRRGLLPAPHARLPAAAPPPAGLAEALAAHAGSLRGLTRALVRAGREAVDDGRDWRDVVGAVRAATPALWASLPPVERARVLRHARPFWSAHRHRMPPEVAQRVGTLRASGDLRVIAGHVREVRREGAGVALLVAPRGGGPVERLRAARVVNATGPATDLARTRDPLLAALVRRGALVPDPLGLGAVTDADGRPIAPDAATRGRMLTVGPLRLGAAWETTAVPELREQARRAVAWLAGLPRA